MKRPYAFVSHNADASSLTWIKEIYRRRNYKQCKTDTVIKGNVMINAVTNFEEDININQVLLDHHSVLLKLCNSLEKIADSLPAIPNTQECLVICRDIFPIVKKAHNFEEKVLFPILNGTQEDNAKLDKNLERLCYEHWEDESFAEEISDVFRTYLDAPKKSDAEKLAYMLRGFFEGIRRHIAFETEYLLPMLKTSKASH